jgi:hypothetical protein
MDKALQSVKMIHEINSIRQIFLAYLQYTTLIFSILPVLNQPLKDLDLPASGI